MHLKTSTSRPTCSSLNVLNQQRYRNSSLQSSRQTNAGRPADQMTCLFILMRAFSVSYRSKHCIIHCDTEQISNVGWVSCHVTQRTTCIVLTHYLITSSIYVVFIVNILDARRNSLQWRHRRVIACQLEIVLKIVLCIYVTSYLTNHSVLQLKWTMNIRYHVA